ncbi:MAG: class I SAM-dependent methyltransferase [Actinomycetota bacterium]|nr:class I SAM-dependent methyltransferase [Actinomycetota bacterium]
MTWAEQSDQTLRAQGRASSFGGTMLARFAVPTLTGLAERFDGGGWFLDVGVGVGELTAAFCDALPDARVVGLDVLPRVLGLAAETLADRDLTERVELREQGVQDLADDNRFDLAWLPAPFIPEPIFPSALARIHAALRIGGWIVVGAGRFDGDELARRSRDGRPPWPAARRSTPKPRREHSRTPGSARSPRCPYRRGLRPSTPVAADVRRGS